MEGISESQRNVLAPGQGHGLAPGHQNVVCGLVHALGHQSVAKDPDHTQGLKADLTRPQSRGNDTQEAVLAHLPDKGNKTPEALLVPQPRTGGKDLEAVLSHQSSRGIKTLADLSLVQELHHRGSRVHVLGVQ